MLRSDMGNGTYDCGIPYPDRLVVIQPENRYKDIDSKKGIYSLC
jgi:hypothetical protein